MVMIPQKKAQAETTKETKPAPTLPKANAAAPAAASAANETAAAAAPAAAAAAPTAAPNLPAAQGTRAVAVAGRPANVVKESFKDAFKVDWNTLGRVQATNGNFVDVEANKAVIGTEVVLELMSYQDNFQISPGTDEDSDIEYVRYSDDGITTTQGENCDEYVAAMQAAGYDKCKKTARVVLAGTIVGGSHDGKLVQLNLPPTSKAQFDRFQMQVSIDVARGKRQPSEAGLMRLKAVPVSKGKNTWTQVNFDYANPPATA